MQERDAASLREEAMRRVDRRYDHTLDECKVPDIHRAEYAEEEKSLREVEGPSAATRYRGERRDAIVVAVCNFLLRRFATRRYSATLDAVVREGLTHGR